MKRPRIKWDRGRIKRKQCASSNPPAWTHFKQGFRDDDWGYRVTPQPCIGVEFSFFFWMVSNHQDITFDEADLDDMLSG